RRLIPIRRRGGLTSHWFSGQRRLVQLGGRLWVAFNRCFLVGALLRLGSAARRDYSGLGETFVLVLVPLMGGRHCVRFRFPLNGLCMRICDFRSGAVLWILVPAVLARSAADLPSFGGDCSVLHHILRAAIRAGEDHFNKSPLPGRSANGKQE